MSRDEDVIGIAVQKNFAANKPKGSLIPFGQKRSDIALFSLFLKRDTLPLRVIFWFHLYCFVDSIVFFISSEAKFALVL